jgi:hypothetical protein
MDGRSSSYTVGFQCFVIRSTHVCVQHPQIQFDCNALVTVQQNNNGYMPHQTNRKKLRDGRLLNFQTRYNILYVDWNQVSVASTYIDSKVSDDILGFSRYTNNNNNNNKQLTIVFLNKSDEFDLLEFLPFLVMPA